MGAGKSAVGPRLAARLDCPFLDADAELESEAGCDVAAIFAREGEAGFRRRERAWIERHAGRDAVIALGGGAPAQPGVLERLLASGTLVWLRAKPETLAARVGEASERPLLAGLDAGERLGRLAVLLAEREPCYARAQLRVETDAEAPETIAARIARALEAEPA